jgi:hypothetical protein
MQNNKITSLSIPPDLHDRLKAEAARVGSSFSKLVCAYCKTQLGCRIINGQAEAPPDPPPLE